MKRCPYCGKEYIDEATICLVDQTPLPDNNPQHIISSEKIVIASSDKKTPHLTFPDYKWVALDAWKCVGLILVFQFIWGMFVYAMDWHIPGFYGWREYNGFGRNCMAIVFFPIGLLTAAYFARTETIASFWKGFGLNRKPSEYVSYGLVMALLIRFFGHFALIYGWGKGVSNYEVNAFTNTSGNERYLFLVPLLLFAPLFEEVINRGFIYKALRGSYSISVSMVLVVAWTAYTHLGQYSHSLLAAFDLSILTIVQCYLREKSDSLWDCVLCHFAFNASTFIVGNSLR